jgi:hypothetical protein
MTLAHALLFVVLPLVVIVIAAAVYISFVRGELVRIARHEYWSDRFYTAAKGLVEDPNTPGSLIDAIGSVNALLNKWIVPTALYSIYSKYITGDEKRADQSDPEVGKFCENSPERARKIQEVLHSGLLAMTYASWVNGAQARSVLADFFSLGLPGVEWKGIRDTQKSVEKHAGSLVPLISSKLS